MMRSMRAISPPCLYDLDNELFPFSFLKGMTAAAYCRGGRAFVGDMKFAADKGILGVGLLNTHNH